VQQHGIGMLHSFGGSASTGKAYLVAGLVSIGFGPSSLPPCVFLGSPGDAQTPTRFDRGKLEP